MVSANICKNQSFLSSLDSFSFMEISKLVLFGSMKCQLVIFPLLRCFCLPQNKEEVRYLKSLALFRVPPDGSSEDNGGKGHSAIEGLPE